MIIINYIYYLLFIKNYLKYIVENKPSAHVKKHMKNDSTCSKVSKVSKGSRKDNKIKKNKKKEIENEKINVVSNEDPIYKLSENLSSIQKINRRYSEPVLYGSNMILQLQKMETRNININNLDNNDNTKNFNSINGSEIETNIYGIENITRAMVGTWVKKINHYKLYTKKRYLVLHPFINAISWSKYGPLSNPKTIHSGK